MRAVEVGNVALTVSRNALCSCGSGKKYKKCCIHLKAVKRSAKNAIQSTNKLLVKTLTNELSQPVRLYYKITDIKALSQYLNELKCMAYNSEANYWMLCYEAEAVNLKLNVPSHEIPIIAQPLMIAVIYVKANNTMLIDLRSVERACKVIEFLGKRIPKTGEARIRSKCATSIQMSFN